MIAIEDYHSQASTLQQWASANAELWVFHVSLKRFALKLYRLTEEEVLFIVGIGCKHIVGPFYWEKAIITIDVEQGVYLENQHLIIDRLAGFELRCSSIGMLRGTHVEFDQFFANWFVNS